MGPAFASVVLGAEHVSPWALLTLVALGTFWFWISTALQFIGTAIWTSLKFLVGKLALAARYTWIALQAVGRSIVTALVAIKDALQVFVTELVPAAFRALSDWLGEAVEFLKRVFGPVYDAIKKALTAVEWIWQHVVRPILSVLDAAESLLRLLERLGVEWAGKLADVIARVRYELVQAFLKVRRELNDIQDTLGLLLDPRGFIARSPFLWTFGMFATDVLNVVGIFGKTGAKPSILSPSAAVRVRAALTEWPADGPPRDAGTRAALAEWDVLTRTRRS